MSHTIGAVHLAGAPAGQPEPVTFPDELARACRLAFGADFHRVDVETGALRPAPGQPICHWAGMLPACRRVVMATRAEVIRVEEPLAVFALPAVDANGSEAAVGVFLTRPLGAGEDLRLPAERLGMDPGQTLAWARSQLPWSPENLERVGRVVLRWLNADKQLKAVRQESRALTAELAATYEEITLLHRLAQHLRLSESAEDLARVALQWLNEVIAAESLAILYLPRSAGDTSPPRGGSAELRLIAQGPCPADAGRLQELIEQLDVKATSRPLVRNHCAAGGTNWPVPEIRQLIVVPLAEGENLFGWIMAFNHAEGGEFGSVEASTLASVAAILGIHSGNIELYRQQAELLAGIVRALTSAIDAKDPYTCGHSDRVARIAVRLAQELGCDDQMLNTVYLAGLLHDIGKIGVDDHVLRKPGKLSEEEYEHIKTHVRIGHNILCDIKKLDEILPGVLHHHEAWDGRGYPQGASKEAIPWIARVVAVADAYDAMASDRPYRKGMPQEKISQILRAGSGRQWDPAVIDAFFRAGEDIRRIVTTDTSRQPLPWTGFAQSRPNNRARSSPSAADNGT